MWKSLLEILQNFSNFLRTLWTLFIFRKKCNKILRSKTIQRNFSDRDSFYCQINFKSFFRWTYLKVSQSSTIYFSKLSVFKFFFSSNFFRFFVIREKILIVSLLFLLLQCSCVSVCLIMSKAPLGQMSNFSTHSDISQEIFAENLYNLIRVVGERIEILVSEGIKIDWKNLCNSLRGWFKAKNYHVGDWSGRELWEESICGNLRLFLKKL